MKGNTILCPIQRQNLRKSLWYMFHRGCSPQEFWDTAAGIVHADSIWHQWHNAANEGSAYNSSPDTTWVKKNFLNIHFWTYIHLGNRKDEVEMKTFPASEYINESQWNIIQTWKINVPELSVSKGYCIGWMRKKWKFLENRKQWVHVF